MMKEMKTGAFIYNDEAYDFEFKTSLSARDKQIFVKTVVSNLIDEEGYEVVIRDLIFDFTIIEMFTNVDTSFINAKDENDNDIDSIILIEHFLEKSNVADIVKANMEAGLLEELNRAIDLNIQYLTGVNPNSLNDSIAKLISTFEKKINEVDLNSMMDMAQKFAAMTGEFTPKSVVDAYIESDVHKKNIAEIESAKDK